MTKDDRGKLIEINTINNVYENDQFGRIRKISIDLKKEAQKIQLSKFDVSEKSKNEIRRQLEAEGMGYGKLAESATGGSLRSDLDKFNQVLSIDLVEKLGTQSPYYIYNINI